MGMILYLVPCMQVVQVCLPSIPDRRIRWQVKGMTSARVPAVLAGSLKAEYALLSSSRFYPGNVADDFAPFNQQMQPRLLLL